MNVNTDQNLLLLNWKLNWFFLFIMVGYFNGIDLIKILLWCAVFFRITVSNISKCKNQRMIYFCFSLRILNFYRFRFPNFLVKICNLVLMSNSVLCRVSNSNLSKYMRWLWLSMDERTSILVFVLTLARYYPREITYNITLDRILTTYIICYFVHDLCFLCVTFSNQIF